MKRINVALLLCVLCTISCCASGSGSPKENNKLKYDIQPDSAVYATLGKTMSDILFSPSKVFCYTILGKSNVDDRDFEIEPHYVRDSLVAKLNSDQISIFQFELLADEQNYLQDSIKVRSPYHPCIEFCFEKKKQQVHILISLSNFSWTLFYDDKRQGNWNYADKRFMERYCRMLLGETLEKLR